jgi:hypothetical protein
MSRKILKFALVCMLCIGLISGLVWLIETLSN